MIRLLRSESGQMVPWTVITLLVATLLAFGVMGASAAYLTKDQVQMAADAAALAAADQATLWESLAVSWHEYACRPDQPSGWTCGDGPSGVVNLGRAYASTLFAATSTGLPGWAVAAGCQAVGANPTATPPLPNPVTVCDRWQLQPGGFGVGYGLGFPSGSDPQSAANAYLMTNTASLRPHGVNVEILTIRTDDRTGEVDLAARATEPGNPLRLIAGRQTAVTVEAGSRRRVAPPPQSGS